MKLVEHSWNDEAGHLSSLSGVVVSTPGNALPYKAILRRISERYTEHSFPTMREAEAFVRRSTPVPPARRTLHDRDASSLNSKGD